MQQQPDTSNRIIPSDAAQQWILYAFAFLGSVAVAFVLLGALIWQIVGPNVHIR